MRDSRSGYLALDTIAALSTAPGGAIAIVRVSGPQAFAALDRLTRRGFAASLEPRKMARARLHEPDGLNSTETWSEAKVEAETRVGTLPAEAKPLDDALAVRFVAPDSFTGEDLVELHVHGGAFVASRVLEAALTSGARQALPGEFSFRAVRNGKLALSQAQAVADLIAAKNDAALALALEKLSGSQARALGALATSLRRVAVLAEAGIDFSDQDLDEVRLSKLQQELDPITKTLAELESSYERGSRLQVGVRTAFVGRPNVGKSSLFNALLGDDRSIVSEIPGTTRDVIREQLTLRGAKTAVTLRLEDTAGLRTSDDSVEREGIARTLRSVREADLVLFLVSAADEASGNAPDVAQQQWAALGNDPSLAARTIGVLTKTDLVEPSRLHAIEASVQSRLGIARWVSTSAVSGAGIEALIAAVTSFCERWSFRGRGEVLLTRLDHLEATRSTLAHLQRARNAPELDLFAADLRQGLSALAPLIGETLPDDILGRIFSDFCIGK